MTTECGGTGGIFPVAAPRIVGAYYAPSGSEGKLEHMAQKPRGNVNLLLCDPQNLTGDSAKCLLLPKHADEDLFLQFLSRRSATSALSQGPQVSPTGAFWDPPMAGLGLHLHQILVYLE